MELIFTCILSAISPGFHRLGHIPPTLHRTSIWPLHEAGTLYDIATTTSYPIKYMLLLLIWVWSSFRTISFSAQSLTFQKSHTYFRPSLYVGLRHLTLLPQIHVNIILQHTIISGQYLAQDYLMNQFGTDFRPPSWLRQTSDLRIHKRDFFGSKDAHRQADQAHQRREPSGRWSVLIWSLYLTCIADVFTYQAIIRSKEDKKILPLLKHNSIGVVGVSYYDCKQQLTAVD
jgi:hypothetical protein